MARNTCKNARTGAARTGFWSDERGAKARRQFVKDDACATWRAPLATSPTFSPLFLAEM